MPNSADWELPGKFLTIPYKHEIHYCKEEYGEGYFNVYHTAKDVRIIRFMSKDDYSICLMAETGNEHDVFVIKADSFTYKQYLEEQVGSLKENPLNLERSDFIKKLSQLAKEHKFIIDFNDSVMDRMELV